MRMSNKRREHMEIRETCGCCTWQRISTSGVFIWGFKKLHLHSKKEQLLILRTREKCVNIWCRPSEEGRRIDFEKDDVLIDYNNTENKFVDWLEVYSSRIFVIFEHKPCFRFLLVNFKLLSWWWFDEIKKLK